MQKILVAGGAGFIGSHLSRSLLKKDFEVICIDNLITGDIENIADLQKNQKFSFIQEDISTTASTYLYHISSIDYIFHLASPASPNKKNKNSYINHPIETLLVNSRGTHNLLELAKRCSAKFLFASTSEVYGDPLESPQKEDYFGNVNPVGIRSVYDEAKRFGETITMAYVRTYNLDARIIRIFNTYGPFMQIDDGRVVSNFINQAIKNKSLTIYGEGRQTRSFCYIDDMIKGIEKAMFTKNSEGEVLNLGNPDERTVREFAEIVKKLTKSQSDIVFEDLPEDDPKVRCPDISKAKKILGWEPSVIIEDGLKKTIEYFKSL